MNMDIISKKNVFVFVSDNTLVFITTFKLLLTVNFYLRNPKIGLLVNINFVSDILTNSNIGNI